VPQEKAQELMENDQECGEKWRASFVKYDPNSCSWKTHQCSLLGDLDEFLETWPQWGLMRDGECWEQRTLEQTIRGTEFGLSPNGVDNFHTPNTTGLDGGSNSRKALKKRQQNWPTPKAIDGIVRHSQKMMEKKFYGKGDVDLTIAVKMNKWPTPRTKGMCGGTGAWEKLKANTTIEEARLMGAGNGGQLNPTWVEWLMGWPLGWTDLNQLGTDKSHCAPQQHGEF
jgi:DNA (cytosine-5)-methyltransferase 1